nr:MAG TPA: hypothetical protein [Caudoviricetes sp.]
MNKRYKFQVGDIVAFTFMGLRFKFRVVPQFEYFLPRMCDYWDISDSTPITFTGFTLEYVSKRRGNNPCAAIGVHFPELTDLGSTCYCILNNSEEFDFWTALMRFAHHGIVKNLTIYTLGDRPVRYNSNRVCKVVNTKAPFKNSIGAIESKSVPVSKEWHLHNATNIDDVVAAIKAASLGGDDYSTQSSSDQCVRATVDSSYKSMSTDLYTNAIENLLVQLYSILSKAPPDL